MKKYAVIFLLFILISCGDEASDSVNKQPDSKQQCDKSGEIKDKIVDECEYKQSCDKFGSQTISWQECNNGKWIAQSDTKNCGEREVDDACSEIPLTGLESMNKQEIEEIEEAELPMRGNLPSIHDLSNMFPPVRSQGPQGSCVAWAAGYYIRSYQEKLEKNLNYTSLDNVMSPAFIYNYHHKGNSKCKNKGMRLSSAAKILKERGIVSWSDLPYDSEVCSVGPDSSTLEKARENRIDNFKRTHISNFKTFLASNTPILVGVDVYSNFQSCFKNSRCMKEYTAAGNIFKAVEGDGVKNDKGEKAGHAIVIVGYSDIKKAYKIVNSWGEYWGDRGFLWISYSVFQKIIKRHHSTGYILIDHVDKPCDNVDCGANGSCESTATKTPYCICDTGYKPEGLSCIQCKSKSYKQCKDGDVFWFNSCTEAEYVANSCLGDSKCKNVNSSDASCTNSCSSKATKSCYDGNIYWLDSCGNRDGVAESCSENSSCDMAGGVATCQCSFGYSKDGDSCTKVDNGISFDDEGNYSESSASHKEWRSLVAINCRKGAGTNNSVVTVLSKNDKLESLDDFKYDSNNNIWFKFKNGSAKECYVRARDKYLEPVTTTETCTTNANKGCYSQDIYWFDSCGKRENLVKSCTDHTVCKIAGDIADCYCEAGYETNSSGECEKKELIVSFDSEGNYTEESAQHKEWESLVNINCRSGAGTGNTVITVLSKNEKLESLNDFKSDSNGNIWFKFENGSGKQCYVRAKNTYLKALSSTGCTPNDSKKCYSSDLYWFDSCGNRKQVAKSCGSDATCSVKDGTADCYDNPDSGDAILITSFPFTDTKNTENSTRRDFNPTSGVCKPSSGSEAGAEYVYKVTIESSGTLLADITDEKSGDSIDIDIHLLKGGSDEGHCIARDNKKVSSKVEPGTYYLVLDTFTKEGDEKSGEYDLRVTFVKQGEQGSYNFPLSFVPSYSYTSGARMFGAKRYSSIKGPGKRKHAGVDLVAPKNTPIYAIADGVALAYRGFYSGTDVLVVDHGEFIVRYGEVDRPAAGIKPKSIIKKGDIIAYVGRLNSGGSMIHFEMYSGVCKDASGNTIKVIASDKKDVGLTDRSYNPNNRFKKYERRCDLLNPTGYVQEWESYLP